MAQVPGTVQAQTRQASPGSPSRAAAPETKVFLLLFLQKKKNLSFLVLLP
jgi:hypothetical protein